MRIGKRPINDTNAPYVIAELGVNHDGSLARALDLTRLAHKAGAEAIKLQCFKAELLMSSASRLATYQAAAGESDPVSMLRRLELSLEDMARVVDLAHELQMHAIVTVFSVELVEPAARLPWDAFKTASPDIIHKPLLSALAATGKPLILSTGASTLPEVGRALNWLRSALDRACVLQCVSSYPAPVDKAALGGIAAIRDIFAGPVGYSDHTKEATTGALAVAAGACMLEKHMTYDRAAKGPDHGASLTPEEFRKYRSYARIAKRYEADPRLRPYMDTTVPLDLEHEAFEVVAKLRETQHKSTKMKEVQDIERDVRAVSRQSIVTTHALPAGHILTSSDLTFKRPGTGLPPYEADRLLGTPLARAVAADTPLTHEDVAAPAAQASM